MQKKRKETLRKPCLASFVVAALINIILAECILGALGSYANSSSTSGAGAAHLVLEPPTKLNVVQRYNNKVLATWSTPAHGNYTGFRFTVIPLTERAEAALHFTVEDGSEHHDLRGLSPGASYQLRAFTLLHDTESAIYASCNFTVRPRSPTHLVVWFRNETTLLIIWQPPFPTGYYTHYKISIKPHDARESELYVKKEGATPAPAQAVFLGLVPGRSYTVSVQTVSESEVSAPLTGQQRTVPTRPRNLTVELNKLQERSFQISWLPPAGQCEFEKYQIVVVLTESGDLEDNAGRPLASKLLPRDQLPTAIFDDLQPGAHYSVTVKTLSGKVTSRPCVTGITLKPLAVRELQWCEAKGNGSLEVRWRPSDGSTQDKYEVSYYVTGLKGQIGNSMYTSDTQVKLTDLLPGYNYTIAVTAISRGEESKKSLLSLNWSRSGPIMCPAKADTLPTQV